MTLKIQKIEKKSGKGDYSIMPLELDLSIIPFEVKKTYFVMGGEEVSASGQHAHIKEKEFFLVLNGNVKLISLDDNGNEVFFNMNIGDGIFVDNRVWHGFTSLSPNCIVIAYSSEHYNPDRSDYIEDKEFFITNYLNEK